MYKVKVTFPDGRIGYITEVFATKDEAEEAALIYWINQADFDEVTEVVKRFEIKVSFDDGDYLYTAINAKDENEVREYYIGKVFTRGYDVGTGWREYKQTATAVEFI